MCHPTEEGGQRCAAHTLAALTRAAIILAGAPADDAAQNAYREALIDYASTPEGRNRLHARRLHAVDAGDTSTAQTLWEALQEGRGRELRAAEAHDIARDLARVQADYDQAVQELTNRRGTLSPRDRSRRTDEVIAFRQMTELTDRVAKAQAAFDATDPGQARLAQELAAARRTNDPVTGRDLQARQRAADAFRSAQAHLRALGDPPAGTPHACAATKFEDAALWATVPANVEGVDRTACWQYLEKQAAARDCELVARGAIGQTRALQRAVHRSSLRQDILDREGAGGIDPANPRLGTYYAAYRQRTHPPLAAAS